MPRPVFKVLCSLGMRKTLLVTQTSSLSSVILTQMAHSSRRQSRRCESNLPEGPRIHTILPFDIHSSPGIGKKTNYQHYEQLKRVQSGSGGAPRTINGPILPEQVWWHLLSWLIPKCSNARKSRIKNRSDRTGCDDCARDALMALEKIMGMTTTGASKTVFSSH